MPKNIPVDKDTARPANKLRIGTRKGGKSANVMSTVALQKILADKEMRGDHNNARRALLQRGVR